MQTSYAEREYFTRPSAVDPDDINHSKFGQTVIGFIDDLIKWANDGRDVAQFIAIESRINHALSPVDAPQDVMLRDAAFSEIDAIFSNYLSDISVMHYVDLDDAQPFIEAQINRLTDVLDSYRDHPAYEQWVNPAYAPSSKLNGEAA